MRTYIIKRLLLMVPTLFAITFISYIIMRVAPGKPATLRAGGEGGVIKAGQITRENYELMKKAWHLDKSVHVGYAYWLRDLFLSVFSSSEDRPPLFGKSLTKKVPVGDMIADALPVTIRLNIIAIFLSYVIAVPIGVWSSVRRGKTSDKVVTFFLFLLYSLPSFWLALMLLWFFGKGGVLGIFPISGLTPAEEGLSRLQYLIAASKYYVLPVACMTYASLAALSRYARVGMLEVLRQDYIRTARAKGLSERLVIFRHAFRNSLIPMVTIFGMVLPNMIGGRVIIETIFSIPGLGRMAFTALQDRDYNTLMAVFTIAAVLTLIGILISDILYAVVDPRIDLEKRAW